MEERASGFQVSPSCSTCQLCLSTSETTRRWRQGLWNIWALSHGLRSSRAQEIRRQIWKGMIRQRAQAFSSPKITVASHFQWWSVTYLLSAKKAQKAEIWHSLSLSGLRIGVLEVVDLLVIQDDVKNSGECVHMAGCLPTHTSDCKTADFLPMRMFSRAVVPFWLFSLFSYLSAQVCVRLFSVGVGWGCILHVPAVFSFALAC